jgi:hypothetical protein
VAILTLAVTLVWPQDGQVLVDTYRRNFAQTSDPATKLNIVRRAAASDTAGMGEFYRTVLDHVLSNVGRLASESALQEMALIGIAEAGEEGYEETFPLLWALFMETPEPLMKTLVLQSLSPNLSSGSNINAEMARYLSRQNALASVSQPIDIQVTLAVIKALGTIGDPVAFEALFGARTAGYPRTLTEAADRALRSLEGDLSEHLAALIRAGTPQEKYEALVLAAGSEKIEDGEKAELAETALRVGLSLKSTSPNDQPILLEVRGLAADILGDLEAARFTPVLIAHFSETVVEYERQTVSAGFLVSAIEALGGMGTREAAQRLTLYLELLNSYRENGRVVDERVILAVVQSLGRLGENVAFADLSFAQYLDYSDRVKTAAKQAISDLKW